MAEVILAVDYQTCTAVLNSTSKQTIGEGMEFCWRGWRQVFDNGIFLSVCVMIVWMGRLVPW